MIMGYCVENKVCKNRQHLNTFQTHFILHAAVKVKKTQESEILTIITPLSLLHGKDLIQLPWNISMLGLFGHLITVCGLHYLCEIASSQVQKAGRQTDRDRGGFGNDQDFQVTRLYAFYDSFFGFLKS